MLEKSHYCKEKGRQGEGSKVGAQQAGGGGEQKEEAMARNKEGAQTKARKKVEVSVRGTGESVLIKTRDG